MASPPSPSTARTGSTPGRSALESAYFERCDQCGDDPEVRVIVLTGAGRGFCAGADMDMLQGLGSGETERCGHRSHASSPWHTTTIPKPVIAAINGAVPASASCRR